MKIKRVNKMKFLQLKDKIYQLFKRGDNSAYLRRLILQAYKIEPTHIFNWIKDVSLGLGLSKQQTNRYSWVLAKPQLIKYKDWVSLNK